MLKRTRRRHGLTPKTLGADGAYQDGGFLRRLEAQGIRAHVPAGSVSIRACNEAAAARRRARRYQRTEGYRLSQRIRKRLEEIFGSCKTIGGLARARFVGRWKTAQQAEISAAGVIFLLAPFGRTLLLDNEMGSHTPPTRTVSG